MRNWERLDEKPAAVALTVFHPRGPLGAPLTSLKFTLVRSPLRPMASLQGLESPCQRLVALDSKYRRAASLAYALTFQDVCRVTCHGTRILACIGS